MAAVEDEILAADADVIVLQAVRTAVVKDLRATLDPRWSLEVSGEFLVASKYRIVGCEPSPPGVGFFACTLETPLGLVDLYDVHPVSPRPGLNLVAHQSKRRLLADGPSDESTETIDGNTALREQQIAAIASAAAQSEHPVMIAGDTNLPELSSIYRRYLSGYQDGFAAAGTGLGYTFPADHASPWMRIDRILTGAELRFTSFSVGGSSGSDHRPVWADVERR